MDLVNSWSVVMVSPQHREALAALLLCSRRSIDRIERQLTPVEPGIERLLKARRAAVGHVQDLYDQIVMVTTCAQADVTREFANRLLQSAAKADHHSPA